MTGGIMDPILRPMTGADLAGAHLLSQQTGWPHRLEDWRLLFAIGEGFVVAGAAGEVLGTAMRTPFGPVSMANMIIVDQALRGRGMGRRLLQAVLDLAPDAEWRLVATLEGLPLYQSFGFVATGTIRQYQGKAAKARSLRNMPEASAARWINAPDAALIHQLIRLDREAHGADRSTFFNALPGTARVAVVEDAIGLAAFGILRPFGRGWALAPLIARNAGVAEALVALATDACPGGFLRLDTISPRNGACPLAAVLTGTGLSEVNRGTAMTRPAPFQTPIPLSGSYHPFALAAQALG